MSEQNEIMYVKALSETVNQCNFKILVRLHTKHKVYKVEFTNYQTVCATTSYKITFNNAIEVD